MLLLNKTFSKVVARFFWILVSLIFGILIEGEALLLNKTFSKGVARFFGFWSV